MRQLSIIVPVYNVEKYIHQCLDSIFKQGLDDENYEVVIVNDGTMDNSMEVIDDIINQHRNITIINQENQGISTARNNGLMKATGEYILFVDSDDIVVEYSLPILLEKAIQYNADIVVADFKRMEDKEIDSYINNPSVIQKDYSTLMKSGWALLMEDLNPRECYIWRSLYKRDFLLKNNILFIPGICFEDIPFIHECYLKAAQCLRSHKLIYIYRTGNASITKAINKKTGIDLGTAIAKTWELRKNKGLTPTIRIKISDNVFVALSVLLYAITHDIHQSSDKRVIILHLKKLAPDLHFTNGKKQLFVNYMYQMMPYTYIALRSFITKLKREIPNKK